MTLLPSGYSRRDITTPDGRVLEVLLTGPDDGGAFVLHHGTPAAAWPLPAFDEAARAAGFQVISYSRPGYGASTESFRHRVADAAADVRAILDALGAYRFVTAGVSGGGPYALACAALLPERCAAAAVVGCAAPFDAAGLDWFAGMPAERVKTLELAFRDAAACQQLLDARAEAMLAVPDGEQLIESLGPVLADADRQVLREALAETMMGALQRAFLGGAAGWVADEAALTSPWGFDVRDVRVPVRLWHGDADRVVPVSHGRWLAEHLPQSAWQIVPDEGHVSLTAAVPRDLVEALAAHSICARPA